MDWEKRKPRLKSNREYWIEKIEENMARDQRNDRELQSLGWTVIRFWEKDVKKNLESCASVIIQEIADLVDMNPSSDLERINSSIDVIIAMATKRNAKLQLESNNRL